VLEPQLSPLHVLLQPDPPCPRAMVYVTSPWPLPISIHRYITCENTALAATSRPESHPRNTDPLPPAPIRSVRA
jgi:hypothetical protein